MTNLTNDKKIFRKFKSEQSILKNVFTHQDNTVYPADTGCKYYGYYGCIFISTICKVVLRIQDYYMNKNTSLTNSFWHLRSFARALVLNEVFVMMYFTKI